MLPPVLTGGHKQIRKHSTFGSFSCFFSGIMARNNRALRYTGVTEVGLKNVLRALHPEISTVLFKTSRGRFRHSEINTTCK